MSQQPPTKDLLDFLVKIHSKSSSALARLSALKAIKRVLKARVQNIQNHLQDLLKAQTKFIEKVHKSDSSKALIPELVQSGKILALLVNRHFAYHMVPTYFE